jgi:hypothetical protein
LNLTFDLVWKVCDGLISILIFKNFSTILRDNSLDFYIDNLTTHIPDPIDTAPPFHHRAIKHIMRELEALELSALTSEAMARYQNLYQEKAQQAILRAFE